MPDYHYTCGMTFDELVGQLMVVGFHGTTVTQEVIELIQRYHVGGIILFSRNVEDTEQLLRLTSSLQDVAREAGYRYPLLIAIDQENGVVRRLGQGATIFPGNMAIGATGLEQAAHDIAFASGRELKALGINMNLAPVVDVNNNPTNPVIGIRSFGEDPRQVACFVEAAVRGYHEAGIITCLKHFPGHGDTAVDSHLALPSIPYTMERLEQVELVPFRRGIAAGADSVMVAHICYPRIRHVEADTLVATTSPTIIQGLLREKLGFDGVIMSDCLEMLAITKTVGTEQGTVLAIQAGIDLALVSHCHSRQIGSIVAIQRAVHTGKLSLEVIRLAAERVLRLKDRYLCWDNLPKTSMPGWLGGVDHAHLRDAVYDRSVTVLKDEDALIPLRLKTTERLLVLYPDGKPVTLVEDRHSSGELMVESIKARHPRVNAAAISLRPTGEEQEQILQIAEDADVIIMVTANAHLHMEQVALMQCLFNGNRRIIGIAAYNPYDLLAFPQLRTYLATYECTPPALEAAVRILFGEVQSQGHLPVSLSGMYPIGYGKACNGKYTP